MECKQIDVAGITIGLGVLALSGISGAATTYSSVATNYAINGKTGTLTGQTTTAFPTLDINTGVKFSGLTKANTATVYVVGVQSGGSTIVAAQGTVVALDTEGNLRFAPQFPSLPNNFCPLSYIVAKAGSTFVATIARPGTEVWNTTGMSYSVVDIIALPDLPQIA